LVPELLRLTPEGSVSVDSKGEVDVTTALVLSLVETEPRSGQAGAEEKYRPPRVGSEFRERLRPAVSFLVVLTFLVLAIVFVLAHGSVADPDIWWHLHNADYLVQHHALPRYDMYSFTVAGHPWINHEWLGELPYYFGWRALGLRGIDAVTLSVLSLIFLGLLYLSYRHSGHYKASVAACCYAVFLASVSFGPRTILFGYAYLVGLLVVLQRFRQRDSNLVWIIPPLFCLWVNTHGSWLIGLILFSIVIGTGLVRGTWGAVSAEPWTPSQRKKLLLVWGMSVAALFVNPFGWRLVFYPFDLAFRQKLNIEHVAEWVSVNFHDLRGKLVLVLLLALVISVLLRSCRWTLAELGLLTFALYSGLTYSRFLFLLGLVVAPLLAKILDFVPRYRREADTPVLNAFVILLMIGAAAYFWPRDAKLQAAVEQQYPVQAVFYLESHPPQGPVLNFYLWGGYINWKDPNLKIFLDSRVDIFEYSGVLQDYLDLLSLTQSEKVLEKYRIRYVLFPPDEPLTYVLARDPGWKVLYRDRISVLLERTKDYSANIAGHGKDIIDGTGNSHVARAATP
jgi:hypothetical protein